MKKLRKVDKAKKKQRLSQTIQCLSKRISWKHSIVSQHKLTNQLEKYVLDKITELQDYRNTEDTEVMEGKEST